VASKMILEYWNPNPKQPVEKRYFP